MGGEGSRVRVAGQPLVSGTRTALSDDELLAIGAETLRLEAAAVAAVADRLDESFASAVRLILDRPGRTIVTGLGKSGVVARKLASTLSGTGTPASFLHPTEAGHGDVGVLVDGDVLLVVSKSGANQELTALIPAARAIGAPVIAITGTAGSPLATMADVTLDAAVAVEACPHDLAPTSSSTAALALGDALAIAIMRARGIGEDDVARLHPAGALGRRLLWTARDVMLTGGDVPRVAPDDPLAAAMEKIAHQRGTVLVTDGDGRLNGVVTAGDLTRFAQGRPDFLERPVSEAMNRRPKSVAPEMKASGVLALVEERGIMAVPVVEGGVVVGIVHLHDLLRAGVRA